MITYTVLMLWLACQFTSFQALLFQKYGLVAMSFNLEILEHVFTDLVDQLKPHQIEKCTNRKERIDYNVLRITKSRISVLNFQNTSSVNTTLFFYPIQEAHILVLGWTFSPSFTINFSSPATVNSGLNSAGSQISSDTMAKVKK